MTQLEDNAIRAMDLLLSARKTLSKIAWAADGGRQFNPGAEATMRELFVIIRDLAREELAKAGEEETS
jgi:hypothetical protein